jgi:hypothetical protein
MLNKHNNRQVIPLEPVIYQVNEEKVQMNPIKRKINSTEFPSITSLDQE